MLRVSFFCLLLTIPALAFSQSGGGFIPTELLRPSRGEAPRYPVDMVIGELGRGRASASAYAYANTIAAAILSQRIDHPAFSSLSAGLRNSLLSTLDLVNPQSYRIGGGREEADGAVSFLVRFIGREYGIIGELFIRYETTEASFGGWVFEELILEDAKTRENERQESLNRYDFSPYERFF